MFGKVVCWPAGLWCFHHTYVIIYVFIEGNGLRACILLFKYRLVHVYRRQYEIQCSEKADGWTYTSLLRGKDFVNELYRVTSWWVHFRGVIFTKICLENRMLYIVLIKWILFLQVFVFFALFENLFHMISIKIKHSSPLYIVYIYI